MIFDIVTDGGDGDVKALATVDWPNIPRVGDTLLLTGLLKRDVDSSKDEALIARARREGHEFKVDAVQWGAHIAEGAHAHYESKNKDVAITVWVAPMVAVWDTTEWGSG